MVWLVSGSYVPVTHTAAPPVCHALLAPFQVSLRGSPAAGIVNLRHSAFPVAASSPATQSRTPLSPPAAPIMMRSLMASGAAVMRSCGSSKLILVSHATLPVSLSVATMRAGQLAGGNKRISHQPAPPFFVLFPLFRPLPQADRPPPTRRAAILYAPPHQSGV